MVATCKTSGESFNDLFYNKDGSFKPECVLRAVISGVIVGSIDRFVLGNQNLQSNMIFAGCVASGTIGADILATQVPSVIGDLNYLTNDKVLSQRLAEVIGGVGISIGVNDYVLKNSNYFNSYSPTNELVMKIGSIVLADAISSMAATTLSKSYDQIKHFV